ncbi:histidinol-phosphate transaminase [Chloroflexota bacterium]
MASSDDSQPIKSMVRSELVSLGGYSAAKSPDTLSEAIPAEHVIKLDANENPYGCSPRVQRALAEYKNWYIYPDAAQTRLRRQLQEYVGVDADCIVAATGSGELLDDILSLFVEPGDEVINCIPTFDLYRMRTLINKGRLVNIVRRDDFSVDVSAVKAAITSNTKMIILCSPNNPTGNIIPRKDIVELANTGVPLLIDEAYGEFGGETVIPLVSQYQNLMVLRTFSKWAGLAGLRVGYGIFTPEVAELLLKIKLPYNVNNAALVAVEESLLDIDYLMERVEAIINERGRLFTELEKIKWLKPFQSQANFIFCSVLEGQARDLYQKLQNKGILVRYFDQPLLENSIRFSVGKPEHTDALIRGLRELEGEING